MAALVNSNEIYAITSITVDAEQIAQATAIVETFAGRSLESNAALTESDLLWVRRAIAYQAAWLTAQADTFERVDLSSLAYDEANMTPRDENSFVLAPMARNALNNCSWSSGAGSRRRVGTLNTSRRYGLTGYDMDLKREY